MSEPFASADERAPAEKKPPRRPRNVPLAIIWAICVALGGGLMAGAVLDFVGRRGQLPVGGLSLWALGALAGYVGKKIIVESDKRIGHLLAGATIFAAVLAEVYWIRYSTNQGEAGWLESLKWLGVFHKENTLVALIFAACAVFGAMAAFRQVGVRYRVVYVEEQ